jgi:NADPH:quinone reductase-like Zn-dependent oxidoreductase
MRAVKVHEGRKAEDLYIADDVPDPIATDDKILVRIKAFGINRMDLGQREGKYAPAMIAQWGDILGVEFSGIVEEKGPNGEFHFSLWRVIA